MAFVLSITAVVLAAFQYLGRALFLASLGFPLIQPAYTLVAGRPRKNTLQVVSGVALCLESAPLIVYSLVPSGQDNRLEGLEISSMVWPPSPSFTVLTVSQGIHSSSWLLYTGVYFKIADSTVSRMRFLPK
jgi:hypothetical protein